VTTGGRSQPVDPWGRPLTISAETKQKAERIRDLMMHRNPTGDLERIFDAALTLLLVKLEKERLGKTARSQGKNLPALALNTPHDEEPAQGRALATENVEKVKAANGNGNAKRPNGARSPNEKQGRHIPTALPQEKRRGHIPMAIRREVLARDGEQCTFVDAEGIVRGGGRRTAITRLPRARGASGVGAAAGEARSRDARRDDPP